MSDRVVHGLVQASHRKGIREVVIVNLPDRIRGPAVVGDFRAAVILSGGREVDVRAAVSIDCFSDVCSMVDGSYSRAVKIGDESAEVRFRIVEGPFSRYNGPYPPAGQDKVETSWATISFETDGGIRVLIPRSADDGRAAYLWQGGQLVPLF